MVGDGKNSYLILKMKLTEEEAQNLIQPEQVEKKEVELLPTNSNGSSTSKNRGPQMDTIRARLSLKDRNARI